MQQCRCRKFLLVGARCCYRSKINWQSFSRIMASLAHEKETKLGNSATHPGKSSSPRKKPTTALSWMRGSSCTCTRAQTCCQSLRRPAPLLKNTSCTCRLRRCWLYNKLFVFVIFSKSARIQICMEGTAYVLVLKLTANKVEMFLAWPRAIVVKFDEKPRVIIPAWSNV